MSLELLGILVLLEIKHFLFDFEFQKPYQLENKGTYGHPGGLLHAGLHAGGTAVILIGFGIQPVLLVTITLGEFLVHYHLDWGKEQVWRLATKSSDPFFWRLIGIDQMLHQFTYIAIAAVAGSS